MPFPVTLDHLLVGCPDLPSGVAWVADRLGVNPVAGGRREAALGLRGKRSERFQPLAGLGAITRSRLRTTRSAFYATGFPSCNARTARRAAPSR